jgi:hypothetical protein
MITDELRRRRLATIQEHMHTEVTKEFDRTLATFSGHPRYEIMATGQVFDGDEQVMGYYLTTRTAFPDRWPPRVSYLVSHRRETVNKRAVPPLVRLTRRYSVRLSSGPGYR